MKATLKDVYTLALTEKKFLNALLKDPEKACAGLKPDALDLPPAELKLLKKVLTKKVSVTSAEMFAYLGILGKGRATAAHGTIPWPPPPPPWWPKPDRGHKPKPKPEPVKPANL